MRAGGVEVEVEAEGRHAHHVECALVRLARVNAEQPPVPPVNVRSVEALDGAAGRHQQLRVACEKPRERQLH